MKFSVLLDTSFLIRLLNDEDPLHQNALGYYKYFLNNEIDLKISTISIAEYCVKGQADDLPLSKVQILPFNFREAQMAGKIANTIFSKKEIPMANLYPRAIIPNDSKLFAQAHVDDSVAFFVTSDVRSKNIYELFKRNNTAKI